MKTRRILRSLGAMTLVGFGLVVPATQAGAVTLTCGQVLGGAFAGQTVVLDADIGPCNTRQGLFINGANGMTLDLNGHSIIGNGNIAVTANNENGIYVFNTSNMTIKGGTITKFNNGIFLDGSFGTNRNNTITGMRLVDNIGPDFTGVYGEGIQIFQDGSHKIMNNQIIHNGPYSGINAYQSDGNTITQNQVLNNNIPSDEEHHGSGPLMQDIGIWIINLQPNPGFSANNTVSQNSVNGNGLDGIQIARFGNNNSVLNNSSNNNGFGQTPGTVIPARNPSCADGDGVANFGSFNTIRFNNTIQNGGNGIAVYRSVQNDVPIGGQSNTITNNTSFQNGTAANCVGKAWDLMDANLSPPCDSNTWTANNEATKNQSCIN